VESAVDKPGEYPKEDELAKYWASFRGPHAAGISAYANLPTEWNGKSSENIIWKTPVPLPGNNSAIVWGDRVFLAGADKKKREIYCFDAKDGKLLWTVEVPSTPQSRAKAPRVDRATGYAAPTMVTDGRRAFAMFANGDLAAVDFKGNVLWSKSLGIPDNMYGHAASLAMYRGRLLVQYDQGGPDDKLSKLFAFDAATGKQVWRVERPVANSWSSPIVVGNDKKPQLITAADPWVISYNPADGKELWRAEGVMGDQGVTPVVANGLVQVGSEYSEWFAIRMDGSGNVTETHIAWQGVDGLPDTVSPLVVKDLLLLTTSNGILTCYDAAKGEMLWDAEFDAEFTSSPSLVGDHVYLIGKKGKGWVGKVTREGWEKVAENDLSEKCVASPAMQDGRLYLRGEKHLFCIGKADQQGVDSKK
jgi:outer membrane protein assembly factor BamB